MQRGASPDFVTIEIDADDIRTVRQTTDQPVRNLRAQRSGKTAKVSWAAWKACSGQILVKHQVGLDSGRPVR